MQNPIQKFKQSSIVFEKFEKLWRVPTTLQFNNFCLNFAHVSYLPMSAKGCAGFFLFCLDLYLQKLKRPGFYTLICYFFINNSRSKQNKKNPAQMFVDIPK